MHREDFPMLQQDLIYFDNGATTFKPFCVIDKMKEYYTTYSANAHRGDYDISLKVDTEYEQVRDLVSDFIGAKSRSEIIFTSGTTDSLNRVVFGFMRQHLSLGDEVLLTKSEHASNVLPWMELAKQIGIKLRYIPFDEDHTISLDAVVRSITPRTKVISIAHITNVVGDVRDVKEIGRIAKQHGLYFVVDGAQSTPHMPIDVQDMNADFFAFSGHKMLGPTGVGVLYGKLHLLEEMEPLIFGGGMNQSFTPDGEVSYKEVPARFEAGTPPIAEVLGLGEAIRYLQSIGMESIQQHEQELKRYTIEKLESIPGIILYNKNSTSGIVTFNIQDIFSQDTSVYLNHYHICVRAGNHCAKILSDEFKIKNTCRISFYLYNTKEEIDQLIEVLKKKDAIFDIIL